MKKTLVICAALLLAAAALPYAEPPPEKRGGHKGYPGKRMHAEEELGLTPEQEAKLRDIRENSVSAAKVRLKELETLQEKINHELRKDKPSKSALNKYAAEKGKIHAQMDRESIDNRLQAKAILTPEQFAWFSEFSELRFKGVPKMRHKSGHGGKFAKKRGGHGYGYGPGGRPHHGGQYGERGGRRHSGDYEPRDCPYRRKFERNRDDPASITPVPPIAPLPEDGEENEL